jgi:hypothetical protein
VPRRVNRQSVAVLREEWRVVDRWWTEEPVSRRYFDLVLETGENAVVYHDGDAGSEGLDQGRVPRAWRGGGRAALGA